MKDKIMGSSIGLFNKYGVSQTSFRDIASSLDISDGHVRYYFKTKESLLLAIFDKMDKEILNLVIENKNVDLDAHQYLKKNIIKVFTIMVNYSFFFVESPKTFNQYPELTLAYRNLINGRKLLFLNTFQELIDKGFFKEAFNAKMQEMAFYNIFIISDSWIRYYAILNNKKPDKETIEFHSNLALSILFPYIN